MPIRIKGPCWETCDECASGPCDCTAPVLAVDSASGTTGTPFSYAITPTNSPTPTVTYGYAGTMPAGLSLDPNTGIISGTPTHTYSGSITISATNCCGTATATLSIVIHSAVCTFTRTGGNEGLDITIPSAEELGGGGVIDISWDMVTVKDRLIISASTLGVFDTGCVAGTGSVVNAGPFVGTSLRVQILPDCDGTGTDTVWTISISCSSPFP